MKRILFVITVFAVSLASCKSPVFTIAVLPDTQTYAQTYPHIVNSQLQWLDSNKSNIDYVLQLGDLTQNNVDSEWVVIRTAFDHIEGKIPYSVVAGNHDMGTNGIADIRETNLYNKYFPASQFKGENGFFEEGNSNNYWQLFEAGRKKWMIMGLEFGPRNEVLDWANEAVKQHSDRMVIIITHCYMYSDSTRVGEGDNWRPQAYGIGKETGARAVNDGEQIWEKLVKPNANIRMVLSGHILHSGIGTRVDLNNHGLPVYQLLQNYQSGVRGSVNGGNGFMRIFTLNTSKSTIHIKTWSPYLREYKTGAEHEFEFTAVPFKAKK